MQNNLLAHCCARERTEDMQIKCKEWASVQHNPAWSATTEMRYEEKGVEDFLSAMQKEFDSKYKQHNFDYHWQDKQHKLLALLNQ